MTNREQWLDWFNNLPTCRLVRMICSCTDCGDCAVFGKPNCRMELFNWFECEKEHEEDGETSKEAD